MRAWTGPAGRRGLGDTGAHRLDAPWKGGKGWAEAGMDGAKAAFGEASAAIGEGWQELTATIGKLFGWDGGPLPLRQTVPTAAKAGGSPVSALCRRP